MSRYATSEDSYSRYAPSSPASYAGDDGQSADPSMKLMRLKVLYTTDDKTNCMARWPKVLRVRTALLDEKTEIGVVELRTCIQAIVTSSPELVAKLGHDYTVYAYDYSEFETPLVGQGMLSWVLASPAGQSPSSTMVTGRVTRNANALFGRDNISQILEVKLRLMPVPTILQSEYIESMKRYREMSRVIPESFDPQGWSEFLKENPQVMSFAAAAASSTSGPNSPVNTTNNQMGLENVQRLMHQGNGLYQPRPQRHYSQSQSHSRRESFAESTMSRDASPTPSVQSAFPDAGRPHSQATHRGELRRTVSTGQMPGSDFDPNENDDAFDEGPSRKRARITQVKRPGKNSGFGKAVDSLRVAASTAASVRVFQPAAVRPGMERMASLEEPPRAPTPVPQVIARGLRRSTSILQARSSLGRFATAAPYPDTAGLFESARHRQRYSPEATSVLESSPGEDPGSSPPDPAGHVFAAAAPSSPQLPRMPMPVHQDSGFMSGTMEDDGGHSVQADHLVSIKTDPEARLESQQAESNANQSHRPRKIAAKLTRADTVASVMTEEERAAEKSRKNALRAIGRLRTSSFTEGQAQQDSGAATATGSKRSRAMSSATDEPKSRHAYDKEKQKQRMDARLQNAIAAGETPAMCMNCGSIHTNTWRKAYKKAYSGSPANVRTGKGPGAIVTVLIEERNEAEEVILFSIIKKSLLPEDEGFQDILLCNPCGLWLRSKGEMRPPRVWNSGLVRSAPGAANQPGTSVMPTQALESSLRSAVPLPSEMTEPPSEAVLPAFRSNFDDEEVSHQDMATLEREASDSHEPDNEPELPTLPESRRMMGTSNGNNINKSRSDSEMPANSLAQLQRAIQSSPGQSRGASKHSPIELDKTPDRTRRALFASPKTSGPLGVTSGNKRSSLQDSPDAPKQTKYDMALPEITVQRVSLANKENTMPPPPAPTKTTAGRGEEGDQRPTTPNTNQQDEVDCFGDLFKDATAPSTPSRSANITLPLPKSPSNLFRTPTRATPTKNGTTMGHFFSSAEKLFLHGQNPSTPTRKTPGGGSSSGGSGNDTPFTRQLKKIFSQDATAAGSEFDLETSPSKIFANMPLLGDDFGTDWPMTTDMPMPSSPPVIGRGHGVGDVASHYLLKTPDGKGSLATSGNAKIGEDCEDQEQEQEQEQEQDDDSPTWDELGLGKTPGKAHGGDELNDIEAA